MAARFERRRLRDRGIRAKNVPCSRSISTSEGAMASVCECFQQAAKCEQMAESARNAEDRAALLDAARQWRLVGKAKEAEELRALKP